MADSPSIVIRAVWFVFVGSWLTAIVLWGRLGPERDNHWPSSRDQIDKQSPISTHVKEARIEWKRTDDRTGRE